MGGSSYLPFTPSCPPLLPSLPPPLLRNCINPFMPTVAFNICCPRDCVSRHNGGTAGAPLKSLRDDSALRALSTLRGRYVGGVGCWRGRTANVGTVGTNGLTYSWHNNPLNVNLMSSIQNLLRELLLTCYEQFGQLDITCYNKFFLLKSSFLW